MRTISDPISLYLFVMAMKVFSRMLKNMVEKKEIQYQWKCKVNGTTHLCFVDDPLMFCNVDEKFVKAIRNALHSFHLWLGLEAKPNKK